MMSEERWLSVEEIALHMGLSKETVYRWLERKKTSTLSQEAKNIRIPIELA